MKHKLRLQIATLLLVSINLGCARQTDQTMDRGLNSSKDQHLEETAKPDNSDWELVWSDEFDGEELDLEKWKYETGDHGWGNDEWQNYTAGDNVEVVDGILRIIAQKVGPGQNVGDYTSTRLNSKTNFKYVRVEVRAKMPEHKGNGLWPAIWMLGENISSVGWPRCGELDIMEYVSYTPDTVFSAIHMTSSHGANPEGSGPIDLPTAEEEFHVYGMDWTETQIKFFIDDPTNHTLTYNRPANFDENNWPFDKPQYILLNLAVGGAWGGSEGVDDSIFPAQMEIDYVRVYQRKSDRVVMEED